MLRFFYSRPVVIIFGGSLTMSKGISEMNTKNLLVTGGTGLVLGHGGAMNNILPTFKFGMGGSLGNGEQWWSWVHMQDLVRLYLFCAEEPISGIVNGTSPHPVKQKHFAKILGKVMHRPSVIKTPGVALKLVLGEFAEALLLHGQKVLPEVAQQQGFEFIFPELEDALQEVVSIPELKKAS